MHFNLLAALVSVNLLSACDPHIPFGVEGVASSGQRITKRAAPSPDRQNMAKSTCFQSSTLDHLHPRQ